MSTLHRRALLGGMAAGGALAIVRLSSPAYAAAGARVVIVGGGAGGATLATYLKRFAPELRVTLVEKSPAFTTCFFSNQYLAGLRTIEQITHSYDRLKAQGIAVVFDTAIDIDAQKKNVTLLSGAKLDYDRLVLSPGIDMRFDTIEGYSRDIAQTMPHAWVKGEQVTALKAQVEAMADGGLIVISVPEYPYRSPLSPYERACLLAHYLKTRKPRSKVIVLDAKRGIPMQAVFAEAAKKYYGGLLEFNVSTDAEDFRLVNVDGASRTLTTKSGAKFKPAVASIIPPQRAGAIAQRAGCMEGDWCSIVPETFLSTKVKDVYIIGDAAHAVDMPKSAFAANNQAKRAAGILASELAGKEDVPHRLRNAFWAQLAPDDSVKTGAVYSAGQKEGRKALIASDAFVSEPGEDASERRANCDEAVGWYSGITNDMFGTTS